MADPASEDRIVQQLIEWGTGREDSTRHALDQQSRQSGGSG